MYFNEHTTGSGMQGSTPICITQKTAPCAQWDEVVAVDPSDGRPQTAIIASINGDGTITIYWPDGDEDDRVVRALDVAKDGVPCVGDTQTCQEQLYSFRPGTYCETLANSVSLDTSGSSFFTNRLIECQHLCDGMAMCDGITFEPCRDGMDACDGVTGGGLC